MLVHLIRVAIQVLFDRVNELSFAPGSVGAVCRRCGSLTTSTVDRFTCSCSDKCCFTALRKVSGQKEPAACISTVTTGLSSVSNHTCMCGIALIPSMFSSSADRIVAGVRCAGAPCASICPALRVMRKPAIATSNATSMERIGSMGNQLV